MWSWPATSTLLPTLLACASGRGCSPWAHERLLPGRLGELTPRGSRSHVYAPQSAGDWWRQLAAGAGPQDRLHCAHHGPTLDVSSCERIFDEPVDGVWASDHFGVVAELSAHTWSVRPLP